MMIVNELTVVLESIPSRGYLYKKDHTSHQLIKNYVYQATSPYLASLKTSNLPSIFDYQRNKTPKQKLNISWIKKEVDDTPDGT
jgi:hypothetical protein